MIRFVSICGLTLCAAAALAQGTASSSVQSGLWEVKSRTDPAVNRTICLSDTRALIQLRHAGAQCRSYVIEDTARTMTVHYSCAANGHGQTTLRIETPRVVQIETQGVANKAHFAFAAEARRIGNCQTSALR
jgi:hypothetical protein